MGCQPHIPQVFLSGYKAMTLLWNEHECDIDLCCTLYMHDDYYTLHKCFLEVV